MKHFLISLFAGTVIGAVCGLLGAGGGMLCVPVLIHFLKLKPKEAHASAIFVILLASMAGSVIYIKNNLYNFNQGIFVLLGALAGSFIGAKLLKKLRGDVVTFLFILVMTAAGIKLVL